MAIDILIEYDHSSATLVQIKGMRRFMNALIKAIVIIYRVLVNVYHISVKTQKHEQIKEKCKLANPNPHSLNILIRSIYLKSLSLYHGIHVRAK